MIDDIVEMILKEARKRPGDDRVAAIYRVMRDIEDSIISVIENMRAEERRKEKDENKV